MGNCFNHMLINNNVKDRSVEIIGEVVFRVHCANGRNIFSTIKKVFIHIVLHLTATQKKQFD